jgi:hypothetical protein
MSADPTRFVLDSFALLAFFQGEAGMERVRAVLKEAEQGRCQVYLSWINLGEVLYITEREQGQLKARNPSADSILPAANGRRDAANGAGCRSHQGQSPPLVCRCFCNRDRFGSRCDCADRRSRIRNRRIAGRSRMAGAGRIASPATQIIKTICVARPRTGERTKTTRSPFTCLIKPWFNYGSDSLCF